MSTDSFGDSAQAADIAVKIVSPMRNMRFRPYRSPKVPPTMMSDARARTYALTTQIRLPGSTSSSRWIDGRATFTIVLSSRIMPWATHIATSVTTRRRALSGCPATGKA
jgi:hypothetical protein